MYYKGKWCTAGGKNPLFGHVDGFQIGPNSLLQFGHRNVSFGVGIPDSGLSHFNVPFGAFSGAELARAGLPFFCESATQSAHIPHLYKNFLSNFLLQHEHTNVSVDKERNVFMKQHPPSIRSPNSPCESAAAKTAFPQMSRS